MSDPTRLRDGEAPPELEASARLLSELPEPLELPQARLERGWQAVEKSARGERRQGWSRLVLAGAASALIGAVVTDVWLAPAAKAEPWEPLAGAEVERTAVPLVHGQVRGMPSKTPARLRTLHGEVVWSDARFLLEAAPGRTTLVVEAGDVVWRDGSGERRLAQGERLEIPAPIDVPSALVVPATPSGCGEGAERVTCLQRLAEGDGLAAENALFELGLVERDGLHQPASALGRFRTYLERFPNGVFRAEARVSMVVAWVRLGRTQEALQDAKAFVRDAPGDPLAPSVRLLIDHLELGHR